LIGGIGRFASPGCMTKLYSKVYQGAFTCASIIFQATGDLRKVSLWLGHAHMQTTEIYLRADPLEKIEAIEAN
jgi:site-specific recombinase XerC